MNGVGRLGVRLAEGARRVLCACVLAGGRYLARGDYRQGACAFVAGGGTLRILRRPGLVLSIR